MSELTTLTFHHNPGFAVGTKVLVEMHRPRWVRWLIWIPFVRAWWYWRNSYTVVSVDSETEIRIGR